MWFIPTIEQYLTIKWSAILIHGTIWMNHENIKLSEKSQTHKITYCMIPFLLNVQNKQTHRDRARNQLLLGARGGQKRGITANRYKLIFWGKENSQACDNGNGCTTFEHTKNHFKKVNFMLYGYLNLL